MIVTAAALPPPTVVAPAAHEVSYGLVRGTASPRARRVVVRIDGRIAGRSAVKGRRFTIDVDLPFGAHRIAVTAVGRGGKTATRTVTDVYGLPRAARPRNRAARVLPGLQREVARLARGFGRSCGVFVQDLTTGEGAGWNARAELPAASTLKLAVAVTALSRFGRPPIVGSELDRTLRAMLRQSDNAAANRVEAWIGGSTSGGSHVVNATMQAIGLTQTDMYGGYILDTYRTPSTFVGIPLTVVDQPSWGSGKRTTAADLARLTRAIWLASGGLGPLLHRVEGFSASDARYLLRILADVDDHGKLDRALPVKLTRVFHKAGWISTARHDNGLVFWRGGVFVAAVTTYRGGGAGTSSDVLAGRVARLAFSRFR
ncbi:MAG: serine hydrolase [Gaiellales bacterium]